VDETLSCFPVNTHKCALRRSRGARGAGAFSGQWVGRSTWEDGDAIGCQQFVDVFSPLGRKAPIGIVGLVLAKNDVPFDWVAFLLPLVHAESFAVQPDFSDPARIAANREFLEYACTPGSLFQIEYVEPDETCARRLVNPFLTSESERKEEILGMLRLLEHKDPFLVEDELLVTLQECLFGTATWIASRLGHREWFQRTFEETARAFLEKPRKFEIKEFLRLRVDAGRLIERTSNERAELALPIEYDIFLSHFHGDHLAADAVVESIRRLSPSARIFRTKSTDARQRQFEKQPVAFLNAARRSACIVYVATPNSIGRAFVRQELGNNALRPILTLLVGISPSDFERQRRRELHVAYQDERIFDSSDASDWKRFVDALVRLRGWSPARGELPPPDLVPGDPSPRSPQEEGDSFLAWNERTRGRKGS